MKVYISGKITGLDYQEAYAAFEEAENFLSNRYRVVNPMKEFPYVEGKTWEEYMIDDIKLLFECDGIFMLEGWQDSKGARIEKNIAEETDKFIIYQLGLLDHLERMKEKAPGQPTIKKKLIL